MSYLPIPPRIQIKLKDPRAEQIPVDQDLKDEERAPPPAVMVDRGLRVHRRAPSSERVRMGEG
jgi:hypothetical protein